MVPDDGSDEIVYDKISKRVRLRAHDGDHVEVGEKLTEGTIDPHELLRMACHIVPIKKREDGGSFLQHVSVGRARNHDIVLRHRSVSKFHAWFEITPSGGLFVKDCESRNHTFINERRVLDRDEVRAGDTVKFGSVETRVCTSEGFWRLARG